MLVCTTVKLFILGIIRCEKNYGVSVYHNTFQSLDYFNILKGFSVKF